RVDGADADRRRAVAMHALREDGDVEVDDVTGGERPRVGDTVADHLVDRGADRLRVTVVVERARVHAPAQALVVGGGIQLVGRDAGPDQPRQEDEQLGRLPAGDPQPGDFLRRPDVTRG